MHNTKKKQELVLWVIKFLTLEYANIVFDYNILIEKEVYTRVIYNKVC